MKTTHSLLMLTLLALIPLTAAPASAQVSGVSRFKAHDRALELILGASLGDIPALRANAIEAMHVAPDRCRPLAERGLTDANPGVRFAAIVTAGMLDMRSSTPAIRPLLNDENDSVRAAAIYAMHTLGEDVDLSPLAGMLLHSQDPGLRSNVAMLLGLIGNDSAIPLLKQAARSPMPRVSENRIAVMRCQIAEAIIKLGSERELHTMRASLFSPNGEVQVIAINTVGAVADEPGAESLQTLLENTPPEVRIASAGSIARVVNAGGYKHKGGGQRLLELENRARPIVFQYYNHTADPIRAQTAFAMGWFDDDATLQALIGMMDDSSPQVRIAAAAAVLRRTHPAVASAP